MDYHIRDACAEDTDGMLALLPRLADFNVPEIRNPDHLWHGDRELLKNWLDGTAPDTKVLVAVSNDNVLLGLTIVTLGEELLSHAPSAHLEVLALAKNAEGHGIGKALIKHTETIALALGAQSMSLHVFANNTRARGLYEHMGFDGELLRYFKPLTEPGEAR